MAQPDIKYEIYINASPDVVWKGLTGPAGTAAIFFGSKLVTDFKVGSPYQYVGPGPAGPETVHVYGKIIEFTPSKIFSVTVSGGDSYGADRKQYVNRLTYTLTSIGAATRLSLVQDQIMDGDPTSQHGITGWAMILSTLKTFVETGKKMELPMA